MEIGTMSAEELAKSFEDQGQNQNQTPPQKEEAQKVQNQQKEEFGDNFKRFQNVEVGSKSAEELAKEFEEGKQTPDSNEDGDSEEEKAAKEKAAQESEDKKPKPGRPKTKLDDSFKSGLEVLFKEQKLNPYSDGTETGYIVPETLEDVLDLIEDNKKSWVDGAKAKDRDELVGEILATKSPAWQFLIQNSELYKDPSELIPLLTAVQNQDYSNSLDPEDVEDQEKIIRASLSLQGLQASSIEDEISDLKERDKLKTRAEALKPILDKYNQSQTEKVLDEKRQEDLKNQKFWNTYYQNLEETVFKSKDLDGIKLKNEHKQLIASALIPDEKIGGLPIYTIIDNLIAQGNFKTLSKITLLGLDEDLFETYFLTKKAEQKAGGIQKVLRQTGTKSNTTEFEQEQEKVKTIRKSSYGYFGG